jgi:hypothetical protein
MTTSTESCRTKTDHAATGKMTKDRVRRPVKLATEGATNGR